LEGHTVKFEDIEHWLYEYREAWQNRQPDQAAALFADNAEYFETPFDAPARGPDAIREYWEDVPRSQEDITFQSRVLAVAGDTAIAHWQARFRRVPSGREVELDGVFVLVFNRAGLCTSLREWWHRRET
jgi:ketosteroid isomerase-like protein